MSRFIVLLLALFAVGCTCETKEPFMKFHRQVMKKTYNWVLADNEASKYKDQEADARAYLKTLRETPNIYNVSQKMVTDGFKWHKEAVDFISYPWVTIARKRGDCDDFMALWEAVFKYKGGKTERVSVTSTEGKGHAMLLFFPPSSNIFYLLSNAKVLTQMAKGKEEEAIRLFYGDKTDCFIRY